MTKRALLLLEQTLWYFISFFLHEIAVFFAQQKCAPRYSKTHVCVFVYMHYYVLIIFNLFMNRSCQWRPTHGLTIHYELQLCVCMCAQWELKPRTIYTNDTEAHVKVHQRRRRVFFLYNNKYAINMQSNLSSCRNM